MAIKVTVESYKDEVLSALATQKEKALAAVGIQAERYAKRACVVDTGRLRASIAHATAKESGHMATPLRKNAQPQAGDSTPKATPEKDSVYIGTNVEYAPYIEYGRKGHGAQPFIGEAMKHGAQYKKIIEMYMHGQE